ESKIMFAARSIATSPRYRAYAGHRRCDAPERSDGDVDQIVTPTVRCAVDCVGLECRAWDGSSLGAGTQWQDPRARIEHVRVAHHQTGMAAAAGRITRTDPG